MTQGPERRPSGLSGSAAPADLDLSSHDWRGLIQQLPLAKRFYRQYLPLFPTAIEQFSFDGFDLVVSISHCCAKSIVRPGRVPHICSFVR